MLPSKRQAHRRSKRNPKPRRPFLEEELDEETGTVISKMDDHCGLDQPNVNGPKKNETKLTNLGSQVWMALRNRQQGWYYKKGTKFIDYVYCYRPAGDHLEEGVTKFSGSEALAMQYEKDAQTILPIIRRAKKAVAHPEQTFCPVVKVEQQSDLTEEHIAAPVLVTPVAQTIETPEDQANTSRTTADPTAVEKHSPVERIAAIEQEFGLESTVQGLHPRLLRLEEFLLGETREGAIFARLPRLEQLAGLA